MLNREIESEYTHDNQLMPKKVFHTLSPERLLVVCSHVTVFAFQSIQEHLLH